MPFSTRRIIYALNKLGGAGSFEGIGFTHLLRAIGVEIDDRNGNI